MKGDVTDTGSPVFRRASVRGVLQMPRGELGLR